MIHIKLKRTIDDAGRVSLKQRKGTESVPEAENWGYTGWKCRESIYELMKFQHLPSMNAIQVGRSWGPITAAR